MKTSKEKMIWVTTNTIDGQSVAHIELSQNKYAIIDAEDIDVIKNYCWNAYYDGNNWYAGRNDNSIKPRKRLNLARQILGLGYGDGLHVDHINGNGLDNRKCNLRICTCAQNQYNQKIQNRNKSSKYRGVTFYKKLKKWTAKIRHMYKTYHLGYFKSEEDAAIAYNNKAKELYGEYSRLNEVNNGKTTSDNA